MKKPSYVKLEKKGDVIQSLLKGFPAGMPGGEIIIWGDPETGRPMGWSLVLHPALEPEESYVLLRLNMEGVRALSPRARTDLLELLAELEEVKEEEAHLQGLLHIDEEEVLRLEGLLKKGLFGW